jgi:hypothetical protein
MLTMRATGLESPVDKNRQDFTLYSGEWTMGRISTTTLSWTGDTYASLALALAGVGEAHPASKSPVDKPTPVPCCAPVPDPVPDSAIFLKN